MTDVELASAALSAPRWSISEAAEHVPDLPGLYAIHGTNRHGISSVWCAKPTTC